MRLENSYLSQPLVSPLLGIHKLAHETDNHQTQNLENQTDNHVRRTDNHVRRTDNQERRTDNHVRRTDNHVRRTDNQERRTDNQERRTDNQERRTDNQERQTDNRKRVTVVPKQEAETGSGGIKSLLSQAPQLRQHEHQHEEEGAASQQPSPSSEKSELLSSATSESSPVLDRDVECQARAKLPLQFVINANEKKFSSHPDAIIPCVTDASRNDDVPVGKENGLLDEFHLAFRKRRIKLESSLPSAAVGHSSSDNCSQSNPDLDARCVADTLKKVTPSQPQEMRSLEAAGDDCKETESLAALGHTSEASTRPHQLRPMTNAQLRLEILQQKLREQREKAEHECAQLMLQSTNAESCEEDARSPAPAYDPRAVNASVAECASHSTKSTEQELKELETKLRVDLDVYLTPLVRSQKNKQDLRYVPETELLESFSSPGNVNCSCQCACEMCLTSRNGITKNVTFLLDHHKDSNYRDNRQTNGVPTCALHETTMKYDRRNLYLHLNTNHNNNNECHDKNKATSIRKNIYWSDQNSCMAKEINYGRQNLWQTDDGSDKKTSSSSEGSLHSLNFSKKTCSPVFTASKFLPGCSSPATEKFPCLNSAAADTEGLSPVTNGCAGGGLDYVRRRQRSGYSPQLFRCDCANCIEIEASESCKWLRAAGFPQYAQMYEELRFPLDLSIAERDHSFLEPESMNALFRRLKILNRCARIRLDHQAPNKAEESEDEEQQCALSSNWLFERHSGRWSRVGTELEVGKMLDVEPPPFKRSGSERIKDSAKALLRRMESMKTKKKRKPHREGGSLQISRPLLSSAAAIENRVAELGCIDLQQEDGATDVPSRMITAPRHRSLSRHAHSQGEDSSSLTSDQSQNSTPLFRSRRRKRFLPSQDDTCARGGDLHSDMSGGKSVHSVKSGGGGSSSRSGGSGKSCDSRGSDAGAAFSDSECSLPTYRSRVTPCDDDKVLLRNKLSSGGSEDSYCRHTPLQHSSSVNIPHGLSGTPPTKEQMLINNRNKIERRESSPPSPDDERHSIYDNVPIIICNRTYQDYRPDVTMDSASTSAREGSGSSECCTADSRGSPCPSNVEQDVAALLTPSSQHLEVHRPKRRNTVERWHSFNDGNKRSSAGDEGMHISHFSAGQMLILRKRALLRLTALMEHHCPSRPTWNWELPKFMTKRFRPSENKTNINTSSQVFGVALQVTQRKTGFPLPPVITDALRYLDQSCSDQVGLFRKPGVRSRIQKLRELIDQGEAVDFATYGAFDVADMVKTYFRELPEVLLTNKISEAFLAIFHYLPETDRMEAMQCALLMLPDENREALMTLLTFLDKMASNSHLNQMTASNLAVCLAPSLFHLCVGGSGVSPLRRKNVSGSPEQKDLNDNKAAHVCLQMMIQKVHLIDFISAEMLTQISFTYLETSQPVHVEDLGMTSSFSSSHNPSLAEAVDGSPSPQHSSDWAAYMDSCIAALIKEVKEKNRAYVSLSSPDPDVEVIYRKVGDGHPLRLWKVTTDVEAPPAELLNRVLQERHLWDDSLAKWRTIARLDRQSDVWQYLTKSMLPKPSNDFCVLRCWRSDMGRVGGSCALVETSVEHPDAKLVDGCTRGIVLVSRYFIQPCGSGKSRVTHVSRIDLRGRSPEWYNKNYGALAARKLAKLRDSFKHFAEGPESKV